MALNQGLKFWFNGAPYATVSGSNDPTAFDYWIDGVPVSGQLTKIDMGYTWLRPTSVDSAGGWHDDTGGTNLSGALDETAQNDTDYIFAANGSASTCVITLGGSNLDGAQPITVGYTLGASESSLIDVVVNLKQGTTIIATWTHTDIPAAVTLYTQTLTDPQRAAVDWGNQTNLKLEFVT